jgi:CheY-like chemotaxis protein
VKRRQRLILVVDDDRETLKLLNRSLELEGYEVVVATDGGSALDLLERHAPDLVLLDVVISGIDGFQVLTSIREQSEIPVIVLSTMPGVLPLREAISLGADDYVRKPVRTMELMARIKAKLRRAGTVRSAAGWVMDDDTPEGGAVAIRTAIRFPSDMVVVFDGRGSQIPEYQGQYEEKKRSILRDAPRGAIFGYLFDYGAEFQVVSRKEW